MHVLFQPFMYGRTYHLRDIDDVRAEIKCYIDRYDITSLQLYDLTAIVNGKWVSHSSRDC